MAEWFVDDPELQSHDTFVVCPRCRHFHGDAMRFFRQGDSARVTCEGCAGEFEAEVVPVYDIYFNARPLVAD